MGSRDGTAGAPGPNAGGRRARAGSLFSARLAATHLTSRSARSCPWTSARGKMVRPPVVLVAAERDRVSGLHLPRWANGFVTRTITEAWKLRWRVRQRQTLRPSVTRRAHAPPLTSSHARTGLTGVTTSTKNRWPRGCRSRKFGCWPLNFQAAPREDPWWCRSI